MAPRLLSERAPVAHELWELLTGWVNAVGHRTERPQRDMLDEREHRTAHRRWQRHDRREVRVDGAEHGAVLHVQSEPGGVPTIARG